MTMKHKTQKRPRRKTEGRICPGLERKKLDEGNGGELGYLVTALPNSKWSKVQVQFLHPPPENLQMVNIRGQAQRLRVSRNYHGISIAGDGQPMIENHELDGNFCGAKFTIDPRNVPPLIRALEFALEEHEEDQRKQREVERGFRANKRLRLAQEEEAPY